MKVNKKNMRLWVAALRSKVFEQGSGFLKSTTSGQCVSMGQDLDPKHCCMGVISEIAIMRGVELDVTAKNHHAGGKITFFGDTSTRLPYSVMDWLGLQDSDPVVGYGVEGEEVTAISANDSQQWSFERIADGIEDYYKLNEPDDETDGDGNE